MTLFETQRTQVDLKGRTHKQFLSKTLSWRQRSRGQGQKAPPNKKRKFNSKFQL